MSLEAGNTAGQLTNTDSGESRSAGKLKPAGDRAETCLQEAERPSTPPVVKKFLNSARPQPGAVRVHHGKANDPDVASTLVHGVITKESFTARDLLYPPKKTVLQQKLQDCEESVYTSVHKAPLGRSHNQRANLPAHCDDNTTYGAVTFRGSGVGGLINPPKTEEELEEEAHEGHDNYVRTHNAYFVGERIDRKYNWSDSSRDGAFGIATPHYNDGQNACKTLRWQGQSTKFYNPATALQRSGNKEKLAQQLGQKIRLKKNTLEFSPGHTFGTLSLPDEYGVGGVVHSVLPGHFMRDRETHRSLVNAVRHSLKKLNFRSFPTLLEAFRHYDKDGKGLVSTEDLQRVCDEFELGVSRRTLDGLMEFCDVDNDGIINFVEFANYLNWKDKMLIKPKEQRILLNESEPGSDPAGKEGAPSSEAAAPPAARALVNPEDLEDVKPGSSLKTVRSLRRPTNLPDHFFTSSSVIGSHDGAAASSGRTYGIPSVRTDLPVPSIKRVSDKTNYGDSSTVRALLQPSVYASHGVHEEHFSCPRTKTEIAEIFRNVGVNISEEAFEEAWTLASMRHPAGEVCVETFHDTLKEIKAL